MTLTTIEASTSFATEKVAAAHIRADKGLLVADSHWMRDWTQHVQKDLILASDEAAADAYGIYKHKSAVVMRDMTPGVGLQHRQIGLKYQIVWDFHPHLARRKWAMAALRRASGMPR